MSYTRGPGPLQGEHDKLKSAVGIVEDGNTATHAIAKGQYVIWKDDLYTAKSDISIGTTLSSASGGNLTAKPNGIGNDFFFEDITSAISINDTFINPENYIVCRIGSFIFIQMRFKLKTKTSLGSSTVLFSGLPKPKTAGNDNANVVSLSINKMNAVMYVGYDGSIKFGGVTDFANMDSGSSSYIVSGSYISA